MRLPLALLVFLSNASRAVQLKHLSTSHISLLDDGRLPCDYMATCSCGIGIQTDDRSSRSWSFVDCSRRNLTSLPVDLPPIVHSMSLRNNFISAISGFHLLFVAAELRRLELSENHISSLRFLEEVPAWNSLRHLDLSHNEIHSVEKRIFERASRLNFLDLSYNAISHIEEGCFSRLDELVFLSLRNNQIFYLTSRNLDGLSSLISIELDNNGIVEVADDLFLPLVSIENISVSGNRIRNFRTNSLFNLRRLRRVDISFNFIRSTTSLSLTRLKSLTHVILDGNWIERLEPREFQSLSVRDVSLCRLPNLSAVDEEAFYDLEELEVLMLSENHRLVYINPFAFARVPRLRVLDLHDSALLAIPVDILHAAPSLEVVRISGNSLHCDCNAKWILHHILRKSKPGGDLPTLRNFSFDNVSVEAVVLCDSPSDKRSWSLDDLKGHSLSDECRPVVVPLFRSGTVLLELGSTATFSCRAIGLPMPKIHWILPTGKVVNATLNDSRIRFDPGGTITVDHLKPTDYGTYTCLASNPRGYDAASIRLSLYTGGVGILVRSRSWNFVSITWNGTDSTISTANYVILYRADGENSDEYGKIQLRPYMRAFTVTNLYPNTLYEFCIGCEKEILPEAERDGTGFGSTTTEKINCISVRTKEYPPSDAGIASFVHDSVTLELFCAIMSILAAGLVLVIIGRQYRRRSLCRGFRLEKEDSSRRSGGLPLDSSRRDGFVLPSGAMNTKPIQLSEIFRTTRENASSSRMSLLESYDT